MEFARRIGQLLFFLGIISGVLYYASWEAQQPQFAFCLAGVLMVLLGFMLVIKNRTQPKHAERFKLVRKTQDKFSKRHEKK